jgi:hypothetical protein
MPTHLFQSSDLPSDRCCLCGSRQPPFHFEDRPTAKDFNLQAWPYCRNCWDLIRQPSAQDPGTIQPNAGGWTR